MSFQDLLTAHNNNGVALFNDMIALGLIPGTYQQLVFGRGTSGDSGSFARIGDVAATEMTAAGKLKISSSSNDDVKTSGTGARTVRVYALDENWNQTTVDIELNGQTSVETTLNYIHPYLARVLTAGTGGTNAGTIYVGTGTVTDGEPATKYLGITAGKGISRSTFFPVPLGYKLVIDDVGFNYNVVSSAITMSFEGCVKPFGGVWESRIVATIGAGDIYIPVKGMAYEQKTLIKMQASSSGAASQVNGSYNIQLFKVND